jgi:hypothetical protein
MIRRLTEVAKIAHADARRDRICGDSATSIRQDRRVDGVTAVLEGRAEIAVRAMGARGVWAIVAGRIETGERHWFLVSVSGQIPGLSGGSGPKWSAASTLGATQGNAGCIRLQLTGKRRESFREIR